MTDFERARGALRLTIVIEDNPDAGSITVVLEDRPMRLFKWLVVDAPGTRVEVALLDARFGVTLDDELFSIVDPSLIRD